MKQTTEQSVRATLASKSNPIFRRSAILALLEIIDEQRGLIEMYSASADEAALKAARREAKIAELSQTCQPYADTCVEVMCAELGDDSLVVNPDDVGPCARLKIELRNLRAQVAEARAAGHPVNLFEDLANQIGFDGGIKRRGMGGVVASVNRREVE